MTLGRPLLAVSPGRRGPPRAADRLSTRAFPSCAVVQSRANAGLPRSDCRQGECKVPEAARGLLAAVRSPALGIVTRRPIRVVDLSADGSAGERLPCRTVLAHGANVLHGAAFAPRISRQSRSGKCSEHCCGEKKLIHGGLRNRCFGWLQPNACIACDRATPLTWGGLSVEVCPILPLLAGSCREPRQT
jgi:hypothetical protein